MRGRTGTVRAPRGNVRRTTKLRRARVGLLAAGWLAVGSLSAACSNVEADSYDSVACPPIGAPEAPDPYSDFRPVHAVLEARCGTLDCHGQSPRPLKIYGQNGLRAPLPDPPPEGIDPTKHFSGSPDSPTTVQELELSWRSVCGLEPEKTGQVVAGDLDTEELTLVRKPLLTEKHKGGRIWFKGDPGDRCLRAWLEAEYVPGAFIDADCVATLEN